MNCLRVNIAYFTDIKISVGVKAVELIAFSRLSRREICYSFLSQAAVSKEVFRFLVVGLRAVDKCWGLFLRIKEMSDESSGLTLKHHYIELYQC